MGCSEVIMEECGSEGLEEHWMLQDRGRWRGRREKERRERIHRVEQEGASRGMRNAHDCGDHRSLDSSKWLSCFSFFLEMLTDAIVHPLRVPKSTI